MTSLALDEASVCHLATLPSVHRDPFDRMLVCQAIEHALTIVTVDSVFESYPVPILGPYLIKRYSETVFAVGAPVT